jgi:hypothetical protein
MFVNATVYARLIDDLTYARKELTDTRVELASERGKREILSRTTAVQESFVEFLCSRVNQLETERVLLLRQVANVDLPAPSMRLRPAGPSGNDAAEMAASIFEDDPSHAPAGWHPDGTVNYGDQGIDPEHLARQKQRQ